MERLPHWVLTNKFPALFDSESATVIEQTARVYGAMQALIDEYNTFVDEMNKTVTQEFQSQDQTISEAVDFMTKNLAAGIEALLSEYEQSGEMDAAVKKVFNEILNEISILNSRMSTFTALEEGSTTGDAELLDIRTGADKTVYASAGDAVRGQIKGISETGQNLLKFNFDANKTENGITIETFFTEGKIVLNGTASAGVSNNWGNGGGIDLSSLVDGEQYTISVAVEGSYSGSVYVSLTSQNDTTMRLDIARNKTFIYDSTKHKGLTIYVNSGVTVTDLVLYVQIEKGATVTPFISYYGLTANDTICRDKVVHVEENVLDLNDKVKESLTSEKYTSFVLGTFDGDGNTVNATYRLRSKSFIPFSAFHKITFDAGYVVSLFYFDKQYNFVGKSEDITSGVINRGDLVSENAYYFKVLFAKNPVVTITPDEIETANFTMYLFTTKLMEYQSEIDNEPMWDYDTRELKKFAGNNFTFGIQTDTHFHPESDVRLANSLKLLERKIGFDFIANLGDVIRGYEYDDVETSYDAFNMAVDGLSQGSDCQSFMLMGNHDNNSMYATATNNIENAFLPSELFALFGRKCMKNVVFGDKFGLYGYCDFENVRVIILNTSDIAYSAVTERDINVNCMNISVKQAEWFSNVALNTEKQVLVLSHGSLDSSVAVIANQSLIISALNEFKGNGGVCIGCIAGHEHDVGATVINGINHIRCKNGGDICELFSVNLANRTITTKQVGADFNDARNFVY